MNLIQQALAKGGGRPISMLTVNGVPQEVILARLNLKRGLPYGKKLRRKPLKEKGLRKDGDRAEVKAVLREHAAEAHAEQKAYETGFWKTLSWSWRRVEKELMHRKMCWSDLGLLAASLGVAVELAEKVF